MCKYYVALFICIQFEANGLAPKRAGALASVLGAYLNAKPQ